MVVQPYNSVLTLKRLTQVWIMGPIKCGQWDTKYGQRGSDMGEATHGLAMSLLYIIMSPCPSPPCSMPTLSLSWTTQL